MSRSRQALHPLRAVWRFSRSLARENDFWIHFLTFKGGVATVALSVGLLATTVVALPFAFAALAIAAAIAIVGVGFYAIFAGAGRTFGVLRAVKARVLGQKLARRRRGAAPSLLRAQTCGR